MNLTFDIEKIFMDTLRSEGYIKDDSKKYYKGVSIFSKVPTNISVKADKNMLLTILINLGSNAIKFTPKGGEVIISASILPENSPGKFTEIVIQDNGLGITDDIKLSLFDISNSISTTGTDNESGTGLGLILCKEFVEKHGGKIWAESSPGKGAKFKFTIPASEETKL